MASISPLQADNHGTYATVEDTTTTSRYRPHGASQGAQDFTIPLQLLQATGNVGSLRDRGGSLSWKPQPSLPSTTECPIANPERRGTQHSYFLRFHENAPSLAQNKVEGDTTTARVPTQDHGNGSHMQRTFSYAANPDETLFTTSKGSRPTTRDQPTPASSIWSTTDPFSTSKESLEGIPAQISRPLQAAPRIQVSRSRKAGNVGETKNRRATKRSIVDAGVPNIAHRRSTIASRFRKGSVWQLYESAKERGVSLQRNRAAQVAFEYGIYSVIILVIYFVLIGVPIWNGAVYWLWWVVANKFVIAGGFSITLGIALFYAFAPLLILFEKDPPSTSTYTDTKIQQAVDDTALLIPCYKSANLIAATLEAALKIFPPSHIFVIANGNSPVPLDNTEEVCRPYGVNHIWSPIGSKIVAQFVGCYAAKQYKNVLLIDDDCALPENFPVVTDRLTGNIQCVGYTIKSVGPNSSKGNLCQQAQDLEYKLSGIQRDFAGRIGSATFPHGAISLWNRQLLVKTFHEHPGFSVSEDWFFGHVARKLGCRITMCSHVFVETETPTAVFFSSGGSRGGFGEMTIFKQRFKRWNFFFVNGMWYNMVYILGSWKLGWWEIGAKIFVFQEVYETLLYLLTPFILPISFYVRPAFCGILLGSTIVMYLINVIIFNEIHLRRKNERLGWTLLYIYYLPYKIVLTGINVASCYWSLWKYARYFAKRHPKVIEDEKAVEVVLRLGEDSISAHQTVGRRMTVRTIAVRSQFEGDDDDAISPMGNIVTAMNRNLTKPEPLHTRTQARALEHEGVAATDYFFAGHNSGSQTVRVEEKRPEVETSEKHKKRQPKTSFAAWCNG